MKVNKKFKSIKYAVILTLLSSCSLWGAVDDVAVKAPEHDPNAALARDDYKDYFYAGEGGAKSSRKLGNKSTDSALPIPSLNNLMIKPGAPKKITDKLVSISVTDEIPLKEVLAELTRRADIDVEIDSNIEGGVIFRAKDRPFSQVIERLSKIAGLKYSSHDGVLRIERDLPTIKNYRMNLLNMVRRSTSSVNINTNLIGAGGESSSLNSGSSSALTAESDEGDIWSDISSGIGNIIAQYSAGSNMQGAIEGASSEEGGGESESSSDSVDLPLGILSVNRQAGVVSVLATQAQHSEVKAYLDHVNMSHSSQVLIEAKILEVNLNDEFRSGINWNFLNSNVTGLTATSTFDDVGLAQANPQQFSLGVLPAELFGINNTSLDASIDLVEKFGTSRTLSSPRLHAMNNQYAVLTFAENFVYFRLDVQEESEASTTGGDTTTLTVSSEIQTVPVGVLLAIQPSIDLNKNEVVMSVRPTLSRVTGSVSDPAVALIAAQNNVDISSEIPVVEIRELDSILRLQNGEVMVIGGLMEERSVNEDTGVPGLSKVPFLGNAFKSQQKISEVVETVIFIKATIVPSKGVTVEDQNFYKKFSNDKKSLFF